METKKYQVLGVKGNKVEILGKEYNAREDVVELTDEEAAQPLAESKIALVEEGASAPENSDNSSQDEGGEDEGGDEGEGEEGDEGEGEEKVD